MYLRSLTIKGFKSFADSVTIDLSPGVSVIVGPNGSGKSNIADAIAWVLGAQGPKTVRSQKMDEVIFAGAGRRAPLGRAEVSIVIDNHDQGLQLDLSEVTITRTLFRSGESEYALNGNPCRLIDLQDLLSDAGVGRQQHVIISQGQLDMLLNARAEERRQVVEEAAGITKFKKRRERTERRLTALEGDLIRASDLVKEVKRQVRPLTQQAAKAKRQLELRDRTTLLRRYISGSELRALEDLAGAIGKELVNAEIAVLEIQQEIAQVNGAIAALEDEGFDSDSEDLFDLVTRSEALSERLGAAAGIALQKKQSLLERANAADRTEVINSLEKELTTLKDDMWNVESQIVELGTDLESLEAEEADFRISEVPEIGEALQGLNRQFNVATGEHALQGSKRSALVESIKVLDKQNQELSSRRSALETRLSSASSELERIGQRSSFLQSSIAEKSELFSQQDLREKELKEQLDDVVSQYSNSQVSVNSLNARVSAYKAAIEEGRAKTQAKALKEMRGFLGALVDVIEIESGYEGAFSAAVQAIATSVLTSDDSSALDGLRHLKSRNLDGSVISLARFANRSAAELPPPRLPVANLRSKVSTTSGEVKKFLDHVLLNTFVVSTGLEDAIQYHRLHSELVFVTLEGERLGPDGYWTASRPMRGTGLALERAVKELAEAERENLELLRLLEDLRSSHQSASKLSATLRAELEVLREEAARLHGLPERIRADLSVITSEMAAVEIEQNSCAAEKQRAVLALETVESELTEKSVVLASFESEINLLQSKMRAQFSKRRELDQRGADLELRAAKLEQARLGLERAIDSAESRMNREIENQEASASELSSWNRSIIGLDYVIFRSEALQSEASRIAFEAKRSRQHLLELAKVRSEHLSEARTKRLSLESDLEDKRESLQLSNIRKSETKVRLETMAERVRRELGIEAEIAKNTPIPEGVAPAQAESVLRELEDELSSLGPINELAELELAELNEKLKFLEAQLDDVKSSRRELDKVITSIDSEMLQVFESAIKDVSGQFSILFSQLFQGGKGRLVLSEPADPLHSGLEIEVALPGKRIKRLSLLSGGERSLVALAFLFSVFESRPSPFYILDEVEAALDDINLNRFLKLIRNFGRTSQLLVISHQKRTMEVADLLYGVTMQEGGSTKVISQRINQPVLG